MEQAKKLNVLSKITKVKGIFLVLLGIVHIIGSYFEYGKIKSEMSKDLLLLQLNIQIKHENIE